MATTSPVVKRKKTPQQERKPEAKAELVKLCSLLKPFFKKDCRDSIPWCVGLLDPRYLQDFDWSSVGSLGRYGEASRYGFKLSKGGRGVYFVKFVILKTRRQRARFDNEVAILKQATSKWPTALVEASNTRRCGVMITKWLDSVSASQLSLAALRRGFTQVIKKIQELHKRRISHGDLAPKNYVIAPAGRAASLVDFEDAVHHATRAAAKVDTNGDWVSLLAYWLPGKNSKDSGREFLTMWRAMQTQGLEPSQVLRSDPQTWREIERQVLKFVPAA